MGLNENLRRVFCSSDWHVEDVIIKRNFNGTHSLVLGYRDGDSDRTRIYEYWIGDEFMCLKSDDFLGMKEFVGMRTDNMTWDIP